MSKVKLLTEAISIIVECEQKRGCECPYCGGDSYTKTVEIEYENANDPTPMYGEALREIEIEHCQDCDCVSNPSAKQAITEDNVLDFNQGVYEK